jgi:DNA polymerase-3 subunit beta
MKFSCEKAILQGLIGIASRAVAAKSTIAALEGLLIEAGEALYLTGYDLKTGIRAVVPAEITEQGSLVLSARLFGDIIRRLPDDVVTVSTQDYLVNITCGISEFNIMGTDPLEFPELPIVEYQNSLILPQRTLRSMITETVFAVSTNDSRPIHTGELFERSGDGLLTVVAVDGYRLALRREGTQVGTSDTPCSFVIPSSALNEVSRICGDTDEPIEIVQGEQHIMFRIDSQRITLITRRLEGEFLNYNQSIPRENPISVTVDRRQLISSIERCSLIISEQQKSPIRCTFGNGVLTLRTATALGNAYDECAIEGDGEELEIGFNNKYLLDALKAAQADTLRLHLNTPVSPCIIEPAEEEERGKFLYMVLPVRLKAGQ